MLRKLSFFLPLVVLLLAVAAPLRCDAQKTINVIGVNAPPGYPYTTIQSGIDAASDGDTVQVGLASYFENISFKGKAITVTGHVAPDGAMPVIQGATAEPAVVFQNGETSSSVFSNFLIHIGGSGMEPAYPKPHGPYYGLPGAIYISGASPSILNNTITQSYCYGVYVEAGAPLIQGNEIDGTGVYSYPTCPVVGSGEAIFITGEDPLGLPVVSANLIQNNVQGGEDSLAVPGGGGAGIVLAGPAIVENNTIRNNNANFSVGGGIDIEVTDGVFILQNLIYGNSAACGGGGIALPEVGPRTGILALIANNTIVDNFSGPAHAAGCAPANQLFSFDGVDQNPGPAIVLVNNIFSGSTADASVDCAATDTPDEIYQPIFDHNILYNAGGSFFGQYCLDVSAKYGNITKDPQFNSPATLDYTLSDNSPAIDHGNTSVVQLYNQLTGETLSADFQGYPRVIDSGLFGIGYPTIDIGAYEFPDEKQNAPPLPTMMVLDFVQGNYQPSKLTAKLQSPRETPTGKVSFFVDGAPLVPAPVDIDGSGVATATGFRLTPGTHALSATYAGDGKATPAIAIINIVEITIIPTTVVLDYNPKPPTIATPITFTVHVTAEDGSIPSPITLTDTYLNTTTTLLTTLYPDSSGAADFTVSLPEGDHKVEALYPGTPDYTSGSETREFTVEGIATALILKCGKDNPPAIGATIPLVATVTSATGMPMGSVDIKQNTTDLPAVTLVNGVATTSTVAVGGQNNFIAHYVSQNGYGSSYGKCSVTAPAENNLALTSSSPLVNGVPTSPAYSPITFTATLTTGDKLTGNYVINIPGVPGFPTAMTVDATGTIATYMTSALPPGKYAVSVNFNATNSTEPVALTATLNPYELVTAPIGDFTLTGPSSITTRTESSGSGTLNLASIDGFQGTVALSCNLPQPTTYACAISPASVALAVGGTGSATVTLTPTLKVAANGRTSRIVFAALLPFTLLGLVGFARRRRGLAALLPLAVLAMLAVSTTACGNDIAYPATQPGSYPFTVTASGTTKGGTTPDTHTLNVTLVLTP